MKFLLGSSFFLAVFVLPLSASQPPGFSLLRFDEDASLYEEHIQSGHPLSQIKYVSLEYREDAFFSIGGEIRQRLDRVENPDFGGAPYDRSDAWLQRYTLHADAYLLPQFRAFVQLYGGFEEGREGGPSPVDENGFEFQNAFIDLTVLDEKAKLFLRLGRQEFQFGSGRLVSVREGPIVRRAYDAGLLRFEDQTWQVDVFYALPLRPETGNFNDDTNDDQELWGLYVTRRTPQLHGDVELYYIGFANDAANYLGVSGEEERHSLGIRLDGGWNQWDWNVEAIYQFGDFGSHDIRAWTVATQFGYTFENISWQPRLGLSTNIASGDDDPTDGDLGSFNAIYPRGSYFSEAAILGPRNFYNIQPSISFSPTSELSITLDTNFYWRLETEDGVYGPPGNLIRGPGGSEERFVGQALSAAISYRFTRELSLDFVFTHFIAGDFLEETGPSEDVDFFELTLTYKF